MMSKTPQPPRSANAQYAVRLVKLLPLLILAGTCLLMWTSSTPPGNPLTWLDAAFTATSAVCCVGLSVRETSAHFTLVGQTIILALIQIGAILYMLIGSLLAVSIINRLNTSEPLPDPPAKPRSLIRGVMVWCLTIELVGALGLMILGNGPSTTTAGRNIFVSVFHAASAFCNAGQSLQADHPTINTHNLATHLVIAPLIVLGGLGYPVLVNISQALRRKTKLHQYSKMILATTAALYLAGVLCILAGQLKPHLNESLKQGFTANQIRPNALSTRQLGSELAQAGFLSITARGAGITNSDLNELQPATHFSLISLMLIGGAPGSTASGLGALTFAVILIVMFTSLFGNSRTSARRIDKDVAYASFIWATFFTGLLGVTIFLLCLSEPYPFSRISFEAVSAVSASGLSQGITPDLTAFGKAVLIAVMILGRASAPLVLARLIPKWENPRTHSA